MRGSRIAFVVVLVGAWLLLPTASAGHADGLDFLLTGQEHSEFGGSGVLTQLTNQHPDQSLTEEVTLETGCQAWVTDTAAKVKLTFQEQTVAYHLQMVGEEAPQTITVSVGKYNSSDGFQAAGTDTVTGSSLLGGVSGEMAVDKLELDTGEYTATQICVTAVNPGLIAVDTASGNSQTTYTQEENYPTPELGSLALSGVGMLALVGLARIRRDA